MYDINHRWPDLVTEQKLKKTTTRINASMHQTQPQRQYSSCFLYQKDQELLYQLNFLKVFFFLNQPTELSDLKLKCVDSRHTKHASCEMVIYIQQATDKTGLCRESGKLMSI